MTTPLPEQPTIFAVVPHFGLDETSNRWLQQCIESLLAQTIPLQAILVVDDCSPCAPDAVVRRFPSVTLMRNASNTGPFAILDLAFANAAADALLLHDSDDWSTPDRLAVLLAAMRRWRADMVGCQVHVVCEEPGLSPDIDCGELPPEPRAALLEKPTAHTMLLPSALVSCELARRIGGFSSGLRFGADSEFVRRAAFAGEVRVVSDICYYRRIHSRSLTRAATTGFGSQARLAVQKRVQAQARALAAAFRSGNEPDLTPLARAAPTRLTHIAGPEIAGFHSAASDGFPTSV